tara:strand:+ start:1112 stop:1417 length:306 start_codon:yes stop_codon:yes gene_type:complete
MTIYVNTNEELLMLRTDEAQDEQQREDRVQAATAVAEAILMDADKWEDCKWASSFRDWNGGVFTQYHKTIAGLVAYTNDDEREVAESAADAMTERLEGGDQ